MRCVTKRAPRIEWMMLYLGDKKDCKVDEILEVGLLMAVSMITPMWIQEIMHSYSEDSFV